MGVLHLKQVEDSFSLCYDITAMRKDKMISIKNKTLGEGIPKICVPLTVSDREELIRIASVFSADGVDMIEWRCDLYDPKPDRKEVAEILKDLSSLMKDTVLLFTYRTVSQGGKGLLSPEETETLILSAAESGYPDMIDVEFESMKAPDLLVKSIKKNGICTVISHHDFTRTPDNDDMFFMLTKMKNTGADIVKIAVMPENEKDVLRLIETASEYRDSFPESPFVTISMGKLGVISRVYVETIGCAFTFASGSEASAPGQIPYKELREVLAVLHKALEEV